MSLDQWTNFCQLQCPQAVRAAPAVVSCWDQLCFEDHSKTVEAVFDACFCSDVYVVERHVCERRWGSWTEWRFVMTPRVCHVFNAHCCDLSRLTTAKYFLVFVDHFKNMFGSLLAAFLSTHLPTFESRCVRVLGVGVSRWILKAPPANPQTYIYRY